MGILLTKINKKDKEVPKKVEKIKKPPLVEMEGGYDVTCYKCGESHDVSCMHTC